MAIDRKQLIDLLNHDIELEYSACIQYVQHAAVISGAAYEAIQKELIVHANEELDHAIKLCEQVDFLGGIPTVDVGPIRTSRDNAEMLHQDLDGEEDAILRYKTRIRQAEELQEYGLRRVLEDILVIEEEHKRDLQMALGERAAA